MTQRNDGLLSIFDPQHWHKRANRSSVLLSNFASPFHAKKDIDQK
jgi:hypothetical protein